MVYLSSVFTNYSVDRRLKDSYVVTERIIIVCGFQTLVDVIDIGKFIVIVGNSLSAKVSDDRLCYVFNEF